MPFHLERIMFCSSVALNLILPLFQSGAQPAISLRESICSLPVLLFLEFTVEFLQCSPVMLLLFFIILRAAFMVLYRLSVSPCTYDLQLALRPSKKGDP